MFRTEVEEERIDSSLKNLWFGLFPSGLPPNFKNDIRNLKKYIYRNCYFASLFNNHHVSRKKVDVDRHC